MNSRKIKFGKFDEEYEQELKMLQENRSQNPPSPQERRGSERAPTKSHQN